MTPRDEQPLDLLFSLAASALDEAAVPHLGAWKRYALGRPPGGEGDEREARLPSDRAAVSLLVRQKRAQLFGRICRDTWCTLAEDPGGRARKELIESVAPRVEEEVEGVPPRLLAAILVREGLGRYCVCGPRPLCAGVTQAGEPCRREVRSADELCWQHRFQRRWFEAGSEGERGTSPPAGSGWADGTERFPEVAEDGVGV